MRPETIFIGYRLNLKPKLNAKNNRQETKDTANKINWQAQFLEP